IELADWNSDSKIYTADTKKVLPYLCCIYTTVCTENLEAAFSLLKQLISSSQLHLDVTALESLEDAIGLLDAGASKLFVTPAQWKLLKETDNIDVHRLVLAFSASQSESNDQSVASIDDKSVSLHFNSVKDAEAAAVLHKNYG